jgi:hypothetical protein
VATQVTQHPNADRSNSLLIVPFQSGLVPPH